jgi:hypothetical protein
MIKRDFRNINKIVKVVNYQKNLDGHIGKVLDFRSDLEEGVPYVTVFIYNLGSAWPIPGRNLEIIGGPGTLTQVVGDKLKEIKKNWQRWCQDQNGKTSEEMDWNTEPKISDDLKQLIALIEKKELK